MKLRAPVGATVITTVGDVTRTIAIDGSQGSVTVERDGRPTVTNFNVAYPDFVSFVLAVTGTSERDGETVPATADLGVSYTHDGRRTTLAFGRGDPVPVAVMRLVDCVTVLSSRSRRGHDRSL